MGTRRSVLTLALGACTALMMTVLAPAVLAQEDGDQERHPVVGAWIGDPTPQIPDDPMELYIISTDGTLHGTTNFGPAVGTWEPTGERAFDLSFVLRLEGGVGFATVRGSGEVAEDGQSLSSTYTVEFPSGTGMFPEGELGPADFTAQRIALEAMGEPVGPLELPTGPGGVASPAASPGASPYVAASDASPQASPTA